MKKIVFCLETMVLGGVEKELISVLKKIYDKYDITLLLLYLEDPDVLKDIPATVKVKNIEIEKNYYCGSTADLVKQRIKKGKISEATTIAIKRCLKIGMTGTNIDINDMPVLEETFDTAISYHVHSPLSVKYVIEKILAKKKVAWIHNDLYTTGYAIQRIKKYVEVFDEFVAVSKKVEKEFRELCPWYRGVVSTAYNYIDPNDIIMRSKEAVSEDVYCNEKKVKILTIGRFTEQKGIDNAIRVSASLKKEKLDFHWFVVGYGPLESTYQSMIKEYDVSDCFTILGKKSNPYPYIKKCDLYVQPSRHEAFPIVILEAQILKKAIVCTNYDGADEQICNGVNGIIVPLNDNESLFKKLAELIQEPEKRLALSSELEKKAFDTELQEIVKHF